MATARFETSADIEKCTSYLRSRSHASYKELSQHLNRDIQGKDRYVLVSARHKLEREGIVFVIRTGIGVERANHSQVAKLATDEPLSKIKRVTRRANRRQKIVNVQGLTADEREAFYVGRAVLGAISQGLRDAFRNKVAKVTRDNADNGPLDVKETIALFRDLKRPTGEH